MTTMSSSSPSSSSSVPLEYTSLTSHDVDYYGSSAASKEEDWLPPTHSPPSPTKSLSSSSSSQANNKESASSSSASPRLRRLALELSLYINLFITLTKLVAYINTLSLSVLAALVDSVLDVVSQIVLNYTEKHSSLQRSSAHYPAGASRLEPIGVLTCAALMGMASFEVLKESIETLFYHQQQHIMEQEEEDLGDEDDTTIFTNNMTSFWSMVFVVVVKLVLLVLCERAAHERLHGFAASSSASGGKQSVKVSDPTLEALAQDHWNDALSNGVAAIALLCVLKEPSLWFLDPIGAILISIYIIHSWYCTGREQIEHLTGKSAPCEFISELQEIATNFDDRMVVDVCRAYHFGPKFLVELEVVLPKTTLLLESHDLGMELQYEIEAREEVERCFVHIDYKTRPYDEHVVSKVPELREKYKPSTAARTLSSHISV